MDRSDLQKKSELEYADFFVNWINTQAGFDYKAVVNPEENSEVDIFAISSTSNPKLSLQVVSSNGETMRLAADTSRRMTNGQEINLKEVELEKWILKAIRDKDQKYPLELKRELILIIEGFMPTPSPTEVQNKFSDLSESPFKGIFYVSLPVSSSTNRDYEKNGFVVGIKEISSN